METHRNWTFSVLCISFQNILINFLYFSFQEDNLIFIILNNITIFSVSLYLFRYQLPAKLRVNGNSLELSEFFFQDFVQLSNSMKNILTILKYYPISFKKIDQYFQIFNTNNHLHNKFTLNPSSELTISFCNIFVVSISNFMKYGILFRSSPQ